jgi:hypothetical protein
MGDRTADFDRIKHMSAAQIADVMERCLVGIICEAEPRPHPLWLGDVMVYANKIRLAPPGTYTVFSRSEVRFASFGMCFDEDALAYDRDPVATSLLTDSDVAEMLRKRANPPCPRPALLATIRSIITAYWHMRSYAVQEPRPKQQPDERLVKTFGIQQSIIPQRIKKLRDDLEWAHEDMELAYQKEIDRLERTLAIANEKSYLPLEKNDLDSFAPTQKGLVRLLIMHFDMAFGPSRVWRNSPVAAFIADAVEKAGWGPITLDAIEGIRTRLFTRRARRKTTH